MKAIAVKYKTSFFTTYFLSLIIIFLIPFSILGFTMYHNSTRDIKSQIETTSLNQLDQLKNMIDLRLTELDNIAVRIAYDPALMPYMVRNDGYAAKVAIDELGKYKANSAIVESIYLYFRGDRVIYSQHGSQTLDIVTDAIYQMSAGAKAQFLDDLNEVGSPLLRPHWSQSDIDELVAYYYPIRPNDSYPYGTLMYTIKESVLLKFFGGILGGIDGSIVVYDQNRHILLQHEAVNDEDSLMRTEALIAQADTSTGSGIQSLKYSGDRFSVIQVRSEARGLTFAAIVPSHQFLQPVTQVQRFLLILMSAIVFFGLIAAALFALRSSKPIRDLASYIGNRWGSVSGPNTGDLRFIREIFTEVYDSQRELKAKMDRQKPWAIELVLSRLLSGSYTTIHQLEPDLKTIDISLEADQFFVMVTESTDAMQMKSIQSAMEGPYKFVYVLDLLHEGYVAVLAGCDRTEESSRRTQEQAADTLLRFLHGGGKKNPVIGIGTMYTRLLHLNRSFIEAMAAIEHKFTQTRGSKIFFEDMNERDQQSLWVSVKKRVRFVESVKRGDKQVALESLAEIFHSFKEHDLSVMSLKAACQDIILQVHAAAAELGFEEMQEPLRHLIDCETLSALEAELSTIVAEICALVETRKENRQSRTHQEIIQYIEQNYCSYDLSLEGIADQFQLSTTHLSRLMRSVTGATFLEYVTRLRIENIKKQLVTTNKPIRTIIHEAGYMDASNFIRKFKVTVGMTPGQYRQTQQSSMPAAALSLDENNLA